MISIEKGKAERSITKILWIIQGLFKRCDYTKLRRSTVDTTKIKPFSTYVCTERFFDSPQFVYNKIFLKKLLQKLVAHIFTLLLLPLRGETLNFRKNSKFENTDFIVFIQFSKTHSASNNRPIW